LTRLERADKLAAGLDRQKPLASPEEERHIVSIKLVLGHSRRIVTLAALAVGLALFVAACGDDDNDSSGGGGAGGGGTANTQETNNPKCGMGNGKKATGTPINLGGPSSTA
jgi:hypothetical protein